MTKIILWVSIILFLGRPAPVEAVGCNPCDQHAASLDAPKASVKADDETPAPVTWSQETLSVRSAWFGYGGQGHDVTSDISQLCDGRTSCSGRVLGFGRSDPAYGRLKTLRINYTCGNNSHIAESRDFLYWSLSCPVAEQPNAMIDHRVDFGATCDSKEGTETLRLPAGYNFCWHHKFDFSKAGQSDSSASVNSDGITIKWKVAPEGFP
jgi:hypothetical protein